MANGKGMTSMANPFGPSPIRKKEDVIHHGFQVKDASQVEYIGGLFKGSMSIIPSPKQPDLAAVPMYPMLLGKSHLLERPQVHMAL